MQEYAGTRTLAEINWDTWNACDTATLLFVVRNGQVLLIRKKRGLGAGKINGPGGRVDPGETPEQAAVRECQEELLITPRDIEFCGQHHFQFVDGYSIHVHAYRAREYDGEPTETDEAVPLWFAVDDIPYDEMWEDDRIWLPLLLQRQPFTGRYIFDEDRMLEYELDRV